MRHIDQPELRVYAEQYFTVAIGILSSPVSALLEFTPAVVRLQGPKRIIMESAFMGYGLLGDFEW